MADEYASPLRSDYTPPPGRLRKVPSKKLWLDPAEVVSVTQEDDRYLSLWYRNGRLGRVYLGDDNEHEAAIFALLDMEQEQR